MNAMEEALRKKLRQRQLIASLPIEQKLTILEKLRNQAKLIRECRIIYEQRAERKGAGA